MSLEEALVMGCGEPMPSGGDEPVHELVARVARDQGHRVAVECGEGALTYAQLERRAGAIVRCLAAAGVRAGDRVAILMKPSTTMVAAVLGVLERGAAYVPMDVSAPRNHHAEILRDAAVSAVIVDRGTRDCIDGLGVGVVVAEDVVADDVVESEPLSPIHAVASASNLAYLIYTSGSTGRPKGVAVEHGQLAASTLARRMVYPDEATFLLVSPLAFDSSVAGLWGTLTAGSRLVVATLDDVRDPGRLVALIERARVTRMLCVPALYGALLEAAARGGVERLRTLETMILAGEPLPPALLERHFELIPDVTLFNEYGPTEATVWATYQRFDRPAPISIGRPIPGVQVYVADESLELVPRGAPGELVIGGPCVARGYFGNDTATSETFAADEWSGRHRGRLYRTGDMARWLDDGTLELLGRRDQQVKVRGQRVELGTIETALRAVPGVRDAAVVTDVERTQLHAYLAAPPTVSVDAVRAELVENLPPVMIPSTFVVLDDLPRTSRGKVDRAQLRLPVVVPAEPSELPPDRDDAVSLVAAAWCDTLNCAEVPFSVNFFDLGGQSLTVFRLQDAIEGRTGIRPSILALYRHTTVLAQASYIRCDNGAAAPERRRAERRRAPRRAVGRRGT